VSSGAQPLESQTVYDPGDIESMIDAVQHWFEAEDFRSYDWWDLWGTKFGGWAKAVYQRNRLLGTPFVGPLLAGDIFFPRLRALFAAKQQFPICLAHIGLGYLYRYRVSNDHAYIQRAEKLVPLLMGMASPMAQGLGWGLMHDWMTVKGLVRKNTPCHTQTGYVFDLFLALHEATGKGEYTEYLRRIAEHEATDFAEWKNGDMLAASYSMTDRRRVVNANSYRMRMLLAAGEMLDAEGYRSKGIATLRYVLSMQKPDGSWPYSEDEPFVDSYHTCFVLKNLLRSRQFCGELAGRVDAAVEMGLAYFLHHHFDINNCVRPFSLSPRLVLHEFDSYDLAEAIGFFADLKSQNARMMHLIHFVRDHVQQKAGWFLFRRYRFPSPAGIPYLRHANSAMFLALTKAFLLEKELAHESGTMKPRSS
jgi:hypothetical protein